MQGSAELHRVEAEAVTQRVGGAREVFELVATFGIQKIELPAGVRETAKADGQKPNFPLAVAMFVEQILQHREDVGIQTGRFGKRFGARIGVKTSIPNGQRKGARGQSRFPQALARFL